MEKYHAEKHIEYTRGAKKMEQMDANVMLSTHDQINVCEDGTLLVALLDGTEIKCRNEDG